MYGKTHSKIVKMFISVLVVALCWAMASPVALATSASTSPTTSTETPDTTASTTAETGVPDGQAAESPAPATQSAESQPADTQTDASMTEGQSQETAAESGSTLAATTSTEQTTTLEAASAAPTASSISSTGVFTISSAVNQTKLVDVAGASIEQGARVQLYSGNSTAAQRFRIVPDSDGVHCVIYNVCSGLVLDVRGGENSVGAVVQQWTYNGSAAQRWIVSANDDGTYSLFSELTTSDGSPLVLDLPAANASDGNGLQLWTSNGTSAQRWGLSSTRTVADGTYQLSAGVGADETLDISGGSSASGSNAQIYTSNSTNAQRFSITFDEESGYYIVRAMCSGLDLDVRGGSRASGAAIQQWTDNGTWAQRWSFEPQGDGSYVVRSAVSGLALDVTGGVASSGTDVQQYAANDTSAQRWTPASTGSLQDGMYTVACAADASYALDITGGSFAEGAGIQIWSSNGTAAQSFEVTAYGEDGYYCIRNERSGKYLTIRGESSATAGATIDQEASSGPGDGQLWKPTAEGDGLSFVSKSGLAMDVAGAVFADGTSVYGWTVSDTAAQRFVLTSGNGTSSLGITDYSAIVTNASGGESTVTSTSVSGTPYLFLPSSADLSQVRLCFYTLHGEADALVAGSSDGSYSPFASGAALDLTSAGFSQDSSGAYVLYVRDSTDAMPVALHVMKSANVASMYITSSDPVNEGRSYVDGSPDHSTSATGSMTLVDASGTVVYDSSLSQIKGRGNSTWGDSDKKPYQIKLGSKTDLLETGSAENKAKTWVLLANATDSTLIRNTISYKLALELGLVSSPECDPVDLYYDGEYCGSYLLSEKVEVNKGRVNITDLESANETANTGVDLDVLPTATGTNYYGFTYQYVTGIADPADTTGGFLLELDNAYYSSERCWFNTSIGTFTLKTPDNASQDEVKYISEYVQEAINSTMAGSQNAAGYFDLDSLAKTYLVNELAKNSDYIRWSSTYFYKDAGASSTIYSGPVWDFDSAYGIHVPQNGLDYTSSSGLDALYYAFFSNNAQARAQIKSTWTNDLSSVVSNVLLGDETATGTTALRSVLWYADQVTSSEAMDYQIWGFGQFPFVTTPQSTYEGNVTALRTWLAERSGWLSNEFATW